MSCVAHILLCQNLVGLMIVNSYVTYWSVYMTAGGHDKLCWKSEAQNTVYNGMVLLISSGSKYIIVRNFS